MGMRASADVVYGVDLGDSEDPYVEYPDDFDPDEDGLYERVADWIYEFRGAPKVDFGSEGWQAQSNKRREWQDANGPTPLGVDCYGYEFAGTVICSASAGSVTYGAEPLKGLGETNHEELERFLVFLEGKGLRFTDPERRKPGWLLLASYG